jgi:alpha-ketoglutarate-dependent 2,4-dichlorophenoxyacetate dioxygenase
MTLSIQPLHPRFVGEVSGVDLRRPLAREKYEELRAAMDRYGVLVFHEQFFEDQEQLAFAQNFDGALHTNTGAAVLGKSRFGNEALSDISNVDETGALMVAHDRRRMYSLGNRLWHTDASFQDPPGRYSMLSAKVVPPVSADTEYADMHTAYDTLDDAMKAQIAPLKAHHSIAYSRLTLGFEFSAEEGEKLKGAIHPLVRINPRTGRKSVYLASHASRIEGWPLPEGRLLLRDLIEHATRPDNVYRHKWRVGDLVIWDNLATMHRGLAYDDTKYRRELRRVTTLDLPITH